MPIFSVPVDGLTVPATWVVGPVSFVPLDVATETITKLRDFDPFAEFVDGEIEKRESPR